MGASGTLSTAADLLAPTVAVAEVFGPTLQGEGPSLGKRAAFIRLGGCNLKCSWCDTPYTWDARRYNLRDEIHRRPVADILNQVKGMQPAVVVITGGEPLLWQYRPGWWPLLSGLAAIAPVEVETNGTIPPDGSNLVTRYNVSPKLEHAGDPEDKRINPEALRDFSRLAAAGRACLKIVCRIPGDVSAAAELAHEYGFAPDTVYVMPEGTDVATLIARHTELAPAVLAQGLNMTTRLHILTWGDERGT